MVTFTEEAKRRAVTFLEAEGEPLAVRIQILDSSPLAPRYDLSLVDESERQEADAVVDLGEFEVVLDAASAPLLEGIIVDWVETLEGGGFRVDNPNLKPVGEASPEGPLADRIRRVIDVQINPAIAGHGGAVTLVDVRDDVAYVEMQGGCQGCGMAAATLTQGVRRILMETVPEVQDVVDITNHAAGVNPYY